MKNKEKMLWIIAIITIIILTTFVISIVVRRKKTVDTVNFNTSQNVEIEVQGDKNEVNDIENNVLLEENNVEQNNATSAEVEKNNSSSEEITKEEIEQNQSNEEKALEIAKKDWGEDYKVVFVNDGMSKSTGRYIVAVRDATTRNAICYYHIDINTGEFKVEN